MLVAAWGLSSCAPPGTSVGGDPDNADGWLVPKQINVRASLEGADLLDPGMDQPDWSGTVLVNFWQSNCAPCEEEMPILQDAHRAGSLDVVGVSLGPSVSRAKRFVTTAGVGYPNLLDSDAQLKSAFTKSMPIVGVPTSFVVVDGTVRAVHVGPFESKTAVLSYTNVI